MFTKSKFLSLAPLALSLVFLKTGAEGYATEINVSETPQEETQKIDLQKVSQAFGHLIGKNLESLGFAIDMNEVIKGMNDSTAGKESPMDETECVQAISRIQEENNLEKADAFMAQNAQEEGVLPIEKGKLHYKIEKQGEGPIVEKDCSPMIRYSGSFLDGQILGSSQEDVLISLDETIPGLSQGIIGMKEGEKRTLYIHPELGYGTSGGLPPNSLLVFEVEVIKANATPNEEEAFTSISKDEPAEIATFEKEPEKAIR